MKNIIFFVTSLNSGGIENYLLRFLIHKRNDIKATVICKGNTFGELYEKFSQLENVTIKKNNLGFFNPVPYYLIYRYLYTNRFDSIVDFTGNFAGLVIKMAKLASIKKRITFYRGSTNHFNETKLKLFYSSIMKRLVLNNSTKILSNSISALDNFFPDRNENNNLFKVVYNGIDFEQFTNVISHNRSKFNIPRNSFVVGHTGRYNIAKNHQVILSVADKLMQKYKDIYFVLCGKNTDIEISKKIKYKTWKDRMLLLGYRDDINQILPVFDMFFFPSITEGQPNSLIEAMACGLPIVASNIDPIKETTPEVIHDELISPHDVDGFVKKIEHLYLNRSEIIKFDFSKWTLDNFSASKLFKDFIKEL